jgi:trk system potassium uptake protein TrkA
MRVLLVGGGKVGSYLARELDDAGHVVSVIEENESRAEVLADSGRFLVIHGDGTDVERLRDADVDRADLVAGVTGRDEANLVACQLAHHLGAKRVLARLNDPSNRRTFDKLEVPVVAVTDLMVQIISQHAGLADLNRIALVAGARVSLIERDIGDHMPNVPLAELMLPQPALLVAVVRHDDVFVPTARTRLEAGDRVVAVTSLENEQSLCEALDDLSRGEER